MKLLYRGPTSSPPLYLSVRLSLLSSFISSLLSPVVSPIILSSRVDVHGRYHHGDFRLFLRGYRIHWRGRGRGRCGLGAGGNKAGCLESRSGRVVTLLIFQDDTGV